MDADDHGNGREQRCLSVEDRLELERLDGVRNELQELFERLYIDHKNLHSQHEKVVRNAEKLARKYFEMDDRTYLKQWRKLHEEEIVSNELGTTIRQYAEKVLEQREQVWRARERLIKDSARC